MRLGDERHRGRLIAATQEHGRRLHNMEVTRAQLLAMEMPDD
ncbi:MAG: hypothetical protein ACLQBX_18500 [Candidatus Limnocylindrales bacterium]